MSGDYSAATDGLSLAISQIAMEEYLNYGKDDPSLSEEERRDLPDSYFMKNGQLMGSPLSFPILCAINYVAYRSALKRFVQARVETGRRQWGFRCPSVSMATIYSSNVTKSFIMGFGNPQSLPLASPCHRGRTMSPMPFLTVNSEGWKPLKDGRFEK